MKSWNWKQPEKSIKHSDKPGIVTISGNIGKEIPPGTLNSVLKQAQLKGQGHD
ncbi:type II toxin-antitoxin system HicA family toxin [Candidatus Promineifilum breve]|uniref:type II toxin-antitoxin system HicA family toxin n=1 Tax=Candidatus Promineifilum breve TaxID=1806508 RepID=UPI000BA1F0CC|nr:type II toxin-antitoxin system HicA family toxin [Candidatus Promineifilum breve]